MEVFEFWIGWRYHRMDTQPLSDGWSVGLYKVQYDGWHYALHLGPIVFGWGDGIPPKVKNQHTQMEQSDD